MVGVTGVLLWLIYRVYRAKLLEREERRMMSGVDASQDTRNWLLFFAVISPLFAANGLANVLHYLATRRNAAAEASGRDPAR